MGKLESCLNKLLSGRLCQIGRDSRCRASHRFSQFPLQLNLCSLLLYRDRHRRLHRRLHRQSRLILLCMSLLAAQLRSCPLRRMRRLSLSRRRTMDGGWLRDCMETSKDGCRRRMSRKHRQRRTDEDRLHRRRGRLLGKSQHRLHRRGTAGLVRRVVTEVERR